MTRLHQVIAIRKHAATIAVSSLTAAYHILVKVAPLSGIARTYRPRDEEGEHLPGESVQVQIRADEVIRDVLRDLTRMYDVVATMETANRDAAADVVVNGVTVLEAVPVTVLLFLEKQLVDLHTFVRKLPRLDPAERWHLDPTTAVYATEPTETTRTKKIPRAFTLAPATEHHQAVAKEVHDDVIVGMWTTVKYSGALPATQVKRMLERVEALQAAVKSAREAANSIEVTDRKIGAEFLGYIFDTQVSPV